ncbi:copper chaperone PCu(A)C [Parvularcula marina]|uniref:copper chaperone PCu(A)C n=1 Tax=Parvularcula marina TaxID=2292771 RepID=UPI003512688C
MARTDLIAKAAAASLLFALTACGKDDAPAAETHAEMTAETGITIENGYVKAPKPGSLTTAAYLDIIADADDVLLTASSPLATVEIHEMSMDDGMMKMRKVENLDLPSQSKVQLKPGGYHLMLINPDAALAESETVEITLTFEKAGEIKVTLPIEAR